MAITGIIRFQAVNAVVGGSATWYPAYTKQNGKFVSERITIPFYVNYRKNSDGSERASSHFMATMWGPGLCNTAAFYFNKGKTLQLEGEVEIRQGNVVNNQGQIMTQIASGREWDNATKGYFQAGASIPMTKEMLNWNVDRAFFSMDSVANDLAKPVGWNQPGTPGYTQFRGFLDQLGQLAKQGWHGGEGYGYAKVGKVNGVIQHLVNGKYVPLGSPVAGVATVPAAAMTLPGQVAPAAPAMTLPGQVAPAAPQFVNTLSGDDGNKYGVDAQGKLHLIGPATTPIGNMPLPGVPNTTTVPGLALPGQTAPAVNTAAPATAMSI